MTLVLVAVYLIQLKARDHVECVHFGLTVVFFTERGRVAYEGTCKKTTGNALVRGNHKPQRLRFMALKGKRPTSRKTRSIKLGEAESITRLAVEKC